MQKMPSSNNGKQLITSFNEIVNYLSNNNVSKIVVSGPQRSGTLITTRALSQELNINFYDESSFNINNFKRFLDFANSKDNFVIQAPGICHKIEETPENFFIVIVYRDTDDIVASQKRINWTYEDYEKKKYFNKYDLLDNIKKLSISRLKYYVFRKKQFDLIEDRCLVLRYETLNQSELWVPKELRPALLYNTS